MNVSEFIQVDNFQRAAKDYGKEPPFDHMVIDDFFSEDVARQLAAEFPNFDSEIWHWYSNPIEVKKVCNNWNALPALTYSVFDFLNSESFVRLLSEPLLSGTRLYSDPGLNGGGWHIHRQGGKLNTHLDYSLHPKLMKQRKLNIIIYMNPDWQESWGGSLGFWSGESSEGPGDLVKSVWSRINRAVIFDITQNSWHGLPDPLTCPEDQFRKSLAAYFLCEPSANVDRRGKALFAPTAEQKNDESIMELIRKRSDVKTASSVYKQGGD